MALDGIFLSKIKDELLENALNLRVDKVQQPTRDEIVLTLRGKGANYRLLICVRADSPRVHFTSHHIDNPPVPPMFCMLLRKHLTGALITDIRQEGLDRILYIDFLATNEIGDKVKLTLSAEIMGKCSNLILINSDGKIIDSVKRVDFTTSTVRQILPGFDYVLPPSQNKLNIETTDIKSVCDTVMSHGDICLSNALIKTVEGISPVISREIATVVCGDDIRTGELSVSHISHLQSVLQNIKDNLHNKADVYMICHKDQRPKDLSFMNITQYGDILLIKAYETTSELLDDFYFERDRINRINHRAKELLKLLNTLLERCIRKVNLRREELKKCQEKDKSKLYGELITANMHSLQKGCFFYEVPNYYDNMNIIRIPCNPALTPKENANKYYKEYRKLQTAESMLTDLISDGEYEAAYIESVLEELSRADTDADISAIRHELFLGGYVKNKSGKKVKPVKEQPPMEFRSSDGYRILVGKNNIQNDKLSMKYANNNDMWLHTQKVPGSHVIIENQGGEVSDLSIEEASCIAAYYSKARESSFVEVDYTKVRNLKKPVGAKPGKVIYHEYYSIMAKPDKELVEKLFIK